MTLHAALQNNKNFASKFCMLFPDGAISLFDLLEKRGEFVIISVRATMLGTHQAAAHGTSDHRKSSIFII